MRNRTLSTLYEFSDYTLIPLGAERFDGRYHAYISDYYYWERGYHFLQNKPEYHIKLKYGCGSEAKFTEPPYENNTNLLAPGKSMYIHPYCTISRTLAYTKYTRVINPWLADVVVVPKMKENPDINLVNLALFINEESRIIVAVQPQYGYLDKFQGLAEGVALKEALTSDFNDCPLYRRADYDKALEEATFIGVETFVKIPMEDSHLVDILAGVIPKDKTVFEGFVQESLGDKNNKPDLATLLSIRDMLCSSDEDTVGAAIKALSMLDYIHYPNSITCVLHHCTRGLWQYHKALNATSVKFMLKQLYGTRWRVMWRSGGYYTDDISQEDYELFKQLYKEFESLHNNEDAYLRRMSSMEFVVGVEENQVILRLKN